MVKPDPESAQAKIARLRKKQNAIKAAFHRDGGDEYDWAEDGDLEWWEIEEQIQALEVQK